MIRAIEIAIKIANITKRIVNELRVPFNPPFSNGLVSKYPKVAPNDFVHTNTNLFSVFPVARIGFFGFLVAMTG
ncbi:MAG TPA: hypothetical protein VIO43_13045 [Lutibacter sp.]